MSPSEELKAAAERIREVAKAATPGPWHADGTEIHGPTRDRTWVADLLDGDDGEGGMGNSAHIALWDPPTALLVADLLDGMAAHWATRPIGDLDIYLATPVCKLARHINGGAR